MLLTRRTRGFTLIELLIVIAIIGVLAAALVPRLLRARGVAQERSAQLYARNVYEAGVAYVSEDAGRVVLTGSCAVSYAPGGYRVASPGTNAVSACNVTDNDSDGFPEVSVTTPTGKTFGYP